MTIRYVAAPKDPRREIIFVDSKIAGDITPNALGRGGWLHCFGPGAQTKRVQAMTWPQRCRSRSEAHALAEKVLLT